MSDFQETAIASAGNAEANAAFAVSAKLTAFACALACSIASSQTLWPLAASAIAYIGMAVQRKWRLLAAFLGFQAVIGALLYAIAVVGLRMPVFSEFTVLLFWNLYPVFITAWDLVTTPPGEISAYLSRRGFPSFVIVGLLVVFRFFPTMHSELGSVAQSMRNRGLCSPGFVVRHPLRTCEYVLIPLLLRFLQTADQLTVSAITRGAERNAKRESYYGRPIRPADVAWISGWLLCLGIVLAFELFGQEVLL